MAVSPKKTFTIIHFNHNTSASNQNVGDEAHVLAIQDAIREQLPEHEVRFVDRPIDDLSVWQLPVGTPKIRRWPQAAHDAYRSVRGNRIADLIAESNRADMVLIGGGGVYMEYMLPYDVRIFEGLTKPLVLYGVGYNHNFGAPAFSDKQVKSIVYMGKKAALQSVRDSGTHEFLKQHGVASTLVSDPAIFLRGTQTLKDVPKEVPKIGLNIAFHGWKQQAQYIDQLVDMYAEVALQLAKTHGAHFYYIVHHPNEVVLAKRLQAKGVKLQIVQGNSRVLKGAYEELDLTISMMLHSTILAFGSHTPSVCIGYDKKNLSFMQLTGQEGAYIDVHDVTAKKLLSAATTVLDKHAATKSAIQDRHTELAGRAQQFARRVGDLLTTQEA